MLKYLTFLRKEKPKKYIALRKLVEVDLIPLNTFFPILMSFFISVIGHGDMSYNSRRSLLSSIGIEGKIAYHLFKIDVQPKLYRKSKWHSQYSVLESEDFHRPGKFIFFLRKFYRWS